MKDENGHHEHESQNMIILQGEKTGRKGHLSIERFLKWHLHCKWLRFEKAGGDTLEFHKVFNFSTGRLTDKIVVDSKRRHFVAIGLAMGTTYRLYRSSCGGDVSSV
uniref:Uncharacterized protein n=1 Tax=Lactuca sativa TaxID=4236 RepID=A0A9R1WN76_LACSA|nr:hypothetical protein LSAT_V11C100003960 [Lactuca sativa]